MASQAGRYSTHLEMDGGEGWGGDKLDHSCTGAYSYYNAHFLNVSLHRISIFNFIVDEKQKEPTVRFISEDPYLQYVCESVEYLLINIIP